MTQALIGSKPFKIFLSKESLSKVKTALVESGILEIAHKLRNSSERFSKTNEECLGIIFHHQGQILQIRKVIKITLMSKISSVQTTKIRIK